MKTAQLLIASSSELSNELPNDLSNELSERLRVEIENCALRLLARRDHSQGELLRKLMQRGFDRLVIQAVLIQLAQQDVLNDLHFAEMYVAERMRKGFGILRIRGELYEKGLNKTLIEQALESVKSEWIACLHAAYERRFGNTAPTDRADYGRRARFLEQRGFPADLIRRVLRELTSDFCETF